MKEWHFYVLSCRDDSFYCGISTDVDRRLVQHNAKKAAKYTRSRVPVRLMYQRKVGTRSAALKMEASFKKLTRAKKLERLVEFIDEDVFGDKCS